jgi:hypothetical protein
MVIKLFRGKNGLFFKAGDKNVIILPACKGEYHRNWTKGGICVKYTPEEYAEVLLNIPADDNYKEPEWHLGEHL